MTEEVHMHPACDRVHPGNANVWKIFTDLFDYLPLSAPQHGQLGPQPRAHRAKAWTTDWINMQCGPPGGA